MKRTVQLVTTLSLLVATAQPGHAVVTFTQLDDDVFVVSHRVKMIGSRGQATKMVYTKAASLCVAAGYSHMKVLEQESQAYQEGESANATIRVQFHLVDAEERLDCKKNASAEYIAEARGKLAKQGYRPPEAETERPPSPPDAGETAKAEQERCTIEQIVAMVKAGLTVEQIKAACPDC